MKIKISKKFQFVFFLLLSNLLTGCSLTAKSQCREWQNAGLIKSTLDSCTQCVDTLGSGSVELIAGCALGLDASVLLNPNAPVNFTQPLGPPTGI